jgi:hypothetical protein
MKLRRLHRRWTISTLLLVVAWSSVVVWVNISPRFAYSVRCPSKDETGYNYVAVYVYGYPWHFASTNHFSSSYLDSPPPFSPEYLRHRFYWNLAGDVGIGVVAITVLTLVSSYLMRHTIFVCGKADGR